MEHGPHRPRVVVLGAGFAGLRVAKGLRRASVDVVVVDRQNHYRDKGSMATIGRASAVAEIGRLHLRGFFAWLAWLFVHLMFLVGFRSRIVVVINWAWAYVGYNPAARVLSDLADQKDRSEERSR